jgi:hypothetical protein
MLDYHEHLWPRARSRSLEASADQLAQYCARAAGNAIADRFGRRERWGRRVKQDGITGSLVPLPAQNCGRPPAPDPLLCRVVISCCCALRSPQPRRLKVGNEDLLQHVPVLRMLGDADLPGISELL